MPGLRPLRNGWPRVGLTNRRSEGGPRRSVLSSVANARQRAHTDAVIPGEPSQGQLDFGPFLLERRIAVGGSSEVFLARPKDGAAPAGQLVIKRPHPAARRQGRYELLEREAELHRAVVHPNVVQVYSAGLVEDEPYLAMEYVEGVDLYRLLQYLEGESIRLRPELAAYVGRRVAFALRAVHGARGPDGAALGLVHRDVTPSNVYLSLSGDVKLGDFGIAHTREAHSAAPVDGLQGKFGYLAPEQVAGMPFDHRADLFSLMALFGEMLIGQRVFPGHGQLAVLLAIRDANIEPLIQARPELPPGLFEVCQRGLLRDPSARFQSASEIADALLLYEQPNPEVLRRELGEWVSRARDSSRLAKRIGDKIRDSMQRMRAVQRATATEPEGIPTLRPPGGGLSQVRRRHGGELRDVPFARLIELLVAGDVGSEDEVSFMGAPLRKVRDIPELARHILPSTTAVTGLMFQPGAPDYQASLRDSSMLEVMARMRQQRETGSLFIERRDQTGSARVKEIYLRGGRLLHVASTERAELLGEYLVRRGVLERKQLELALKRISLYGGRLGDTLINLGVVEAIEVFHAIRDQGRDRVATLCSWPRGAVAFYRGNAPLHVEFPLDLDLTSPMMAGIIIRSQGEPRQLLPNDRKRIVPGPRAEALSDPEERGTAPSSLLQVVPLVGSKLTLHDVLLTLTTGRERRDGRAVSPKEACAALVTAQLLGWIAFQ